MGMCFNSLQTGRCFRTDGEKQQATQFVECVSIPFKREGVSEQHPLRTQSQCGLKLPIPNATEFRDFSRQKF